MGNRFHKWQIDALKTAFEESEHLTKAKKRELEGVTGLDVEQVSSWFHRRRARKRERQSVGDWERINAELRQSIKECQEKVAELEKELEESKIWVAQLETENQSLESVLAIAQGSSHFDPLLRLINGHP